MSSGRTSLKKLLEENDYLGSGNEEVVNLPLSVIRPNPYQPRYVFDDDRINDCGNKLQ